MRLLNIGRDEFEMETKEFVILWSYTRPIAYYDRSVNQHFQTDEHLSPSSEKHLAKWLRARDAVGKTKKLSQYVLEKNLDPYSSAEEVKAES